MQTTLPQLQGKNSSYNLRIYQIFLFDNVAQPWNLLYSLNFWVVQTQIKSNFHNNTME